MKLVILILALIVTSTGFTKGKHHQHEAHVHGGGQLAIAFDDLNGKINFTAAAEAVLGFEHKARSEKDKKTLSAMVVKFENEIGKFIQFDSALGCVFTKELIDQVLEKGEEQSGEHSDWTANYTVVCKKSPLGTNLVVDFSSFKHLKDIDVTVLIGSVQKSAEFKKKPLNIELK